MYLKCVCDFYITSRSNGIVPRSKLYHTLHPIGNLMSFVSLANDSHLFSNWHFNLNCFGKANRKTLFSLQIAEILTLFLCLRRKNCAKIIIVLICWFLGRDWNQNDLRVWERWAVRNRRRACEREGERKGKISLFM